MLLDETVKHEAKLAFEMFRIKQEKQERKKEHNSWWLATRKAWEKILGERITWRKLQKNQSQSLLLPQIDLCCFSKKANIIKTYQSVLCEGDNDFRANLWWAWASVVSRSFAHYVNLSTYICLRFGWLQASPSQAWCIGTESDPPWRSQLGSHCCCCFSVAK